MMNSSFMNERAKTLGKHLSEKSSSRVKTIENVYNKLYSRLPEQVKLKSLMHGFGEKPDMKTWSYMLRHFSAHMK